MFDTNNIVNNVSTKIKINAVGGTLVKNYTKSFFVRFHMNSDYARQLLCEHPHISDYNRYSQTPVVVLQVMLCGDKELMAEVMYKDDFDKAQGPTIGAVD